MSSPKHTSIDQGIDEHSNVQDTNPQSGAPKKPTSDRFEAKFTGVWCYVIFVVLEVCFSALAIYCWESPRHLPYISIIPMTRTIKSGLQTIFNLWHTIAIAAAASICAESFSQEWVARQNHPIDVVSTVTSGLIQRSLYFWTPRATKTFRVAFTASVLLILMHITSSSTITVSSGVAHKKQLPVGLLSNISLSTGLMSLNMQGFYDNVNRAGSIVQLEKLSGSPWGFSPERNWLIPLPSTLKNVTGRLEYNTDLVQFKHTCNWRAPDIVNGTSVFFDGQRWELDDGPHEDDDISRASNGSSIRQLWPSSTIHNLTGTSVYIFFGGNSSFSVNATYSNDTWIDLSGLPTLHNRDFFTIFSAATQRTSWVSSPLASLLLCEPNIYLTSGTVTLEHSVDISNADVTINLESVGKTDATENIDIGVARILFSIALFSASNIADGLFSDDLSDHINFNSITTKLFMPADPPSGDWRNSSGVRPISPALINDMVDDYQLSALKAFTSGFSPQSSLIHTQGVFSTHVSASYVDNGLSLTTSLIYAILHLVLAGTDIILLLILVVLNKRLDRQPFSLEYIRYYYHSKGFRD